MERGEKSLNIISIGRQGGWQRIRMGGKMLNRNKYLPESSLRNYATDFFFLNPIGERECICWAT